MSQLEYHWWHDTTFLGTNDIVKYSSHPNRVGGWLQARIRPCQKHQPELVWYGNCKDCLNNYKDDNSWMWDF